jgi:PAS domain S-box-containing protein
VLHSGSVRRRQSGVLVVGAAEPQVHPWLRAAGHPTRAVPDAKAASRALRDEPADLVIVDRELDGREVADCVATLRDDPRIEEAWLLAITMKGRLADAALKAGADDYLHRPFTRGELLARARAGLRAAQQRADDKLVRSLMVHVPGAIYRSAWHDGHRVELISDEIERISGYPPHNFIASTRRTLMSIVHPDDRAAVERAVEAASSGGEPFELEYRIVTAEGEERWVLDRGTPVPGPGGRLWMDGAIVDVTERRAAEEALRVREVESAREDALKASRARIVQAADAARRKIERDLHDGAQQRLVSLALEVRLARSQVEKDPAVAGAFLERFGTELLEASAELRELARGIHPAVLTDRGLAPAIAALAARAPVPVEVLDVPGDRLAEAAETTAYFTVAEALTNVAKYADASLATVRVACEDSELVVEIRDDGIGGADPDGGSGLSGLADRVAACDGELSVSSPPGEGTLVRAVLPLAAAAR